MTVEIQTRIEARRGCGFRTPGGIYLVAPATGHPCCKLPFLLETCPTCGGGIHAARGWTWVDAGKLFGSGLCVQVQEDLFGQGVIESKQIRIPCPLSIPDLIGKAGLIWVGEAYYKTPGDFLTEVNTMGVSRRIPAIPNGFKLGETWVLLAHRKVIPYEEDIKGGLLEKSGVQLTETKYKPAIFSVFRPSAIEYVVKGSESEEELERLIKRGMTLVDVNPRKSRNNV